MNRLAFSRAYLCGAMDRVKDGGIGWRQHLRHELADLQINWLDPTCKPIDIGKEDPESRRMLQEAKQRGDFDYIHQTVKVIRYVDLRMVDICDWVVASIDLDVHACGTYEEIFLANRQKKPVLIHVRQGKREAPGWLFGTFPHQHIFGSWGEVIQYVQHITSGIEVERFNRWYFFDWMGEASK